MKEIKEILKSVDLEPDPSLEIDDEMIAVHYVVEKMMLHLLMFRFSIIKWPI